MFPVIDKRETGIRLRKIMDMRGVTAKDVQDYLGFGCVQSVYRWLEGISLPTLDNLYALSELLQVPMDLLISGTREVAAPAACSEDRRPIFTYYKKLDGQEAA